MVRTPDRWNRTRDASPATAFGEVISLEGALLALVISPAVDQENAHRPAVLLRKLIFAKAAVAAPDNRRVRARRLDQRR
jgi:hypothetical protein